MVLVDDHRDHAEVPFCRRCSRVRELACLVPADSDRWRRVTLNDLEVHVFYRLLRRVSISQARRGPEKLTW